MTMPYRGVLDLNTQVRRLEVLSALVRLLGREALSEQALQARLFRWSTAQERESPQYSLASGKVTSGGEPKPAAARRYLSFAQAIQLIVNVSGMYRLTRLGLILFPFLTEPSETGIALVSQRLFFGYVLLMQDADIMLTVVTQMLDRPQSKIVEYQRGFRDYHVRRLNHRIEASGDDRVRQSLLERRTQILSWRKPNEYPEHIVPPRLNWLCGLDFAEGWKPPDKLRESTRRFRLTPHGERFFTQLPPLGEAQYEYDVSPDWLQRAYFSHLAKCLGTTSVSQFTPDSREALVARHVDLAFHEFRRAIAMQVPLSQVVLYSALSAWARENVAIDLDDIVTWLASGRAIASGNSHMRYVVNQAPRENEAFVLLSARDSERR